MRRRDSFWIAGALLLCLAATLSAGPIVVDAGWYGFCFGDPGSPATAGCQNYGVGESGNPTTFTATGPVLFKITDAFSSGDSFTVNIDSGAIVFTTPSVAAVLLDVSDPDAAYADPRFSHGSALLGAGLHTVNVFAADSPWTGGGAYLEVESSAVPEPATPLLVVGGLAAGFLLRRRERRR